MIIFYWFFKNAKELVDQYKHRKKNINAAYVSLSVRIQTTVIWQILWFKTNVQHSCPNSIYRKS